MSRFMANLVNGWVRKSIAMKYLTKRGTSRRPRKDLNRCIEPQQRKHDLQLTETPAASVERCIKAKADCEILHRVYSNVGCENFATVKRIFNSPINTDWQKWVV